MAVGAHHQHVEAGAVDQIAKRHVGHAAHGQRLGRDAAAAQQRRRIGQPALGLGGLHADGDDGDLEVREQRRAGDIVDRLQRRGAAVMCDQHLLDRPEGARGDQNRMLCRAHDPFEIRTEVLDGEIGRLAAFADQHHLGAHLVAGERVEQIAVHKLARNRLHATPGQHVARILEDGDAAMGDEAGALFIDRGQLGLQRRARAQPLGRGGRAAPAENVQKLDRGVQTLGHPGGVVAHAGRIDRAVDEGDDPFAHDNLEAPEEPFDIASLFAGGRKGPCSRSCVCRHGCAGRRLGGR
ncbi:hypothetical protein SDC9_06569 [bioreactor metagenome]|uniref:Uncharacterized protein n=1 Tax=bioreactor metagenome TaxID=1076179 RepID=A0A644T275_9ZZZZ